MLITGGERLQQLVYSLLRQLQTGLMVILLGRYNLHMLEPHTCVGYHLIDVSIGLGLICKCIYQMRLGSAFGAFLDPVADKVGSSSLLDLVERNRTNLVKFRYGSNILHELTFLCYSLWLLPHWSYYVHNPWRFLCLVIFLGFWLYLQ